MVSVSQGTERIEIAEEIFLGRDPQRCRIHFEEDAKVSRVHARIFRQETSYFLEDLASRNGTLLNGRRVHSRVVLRGGDVLTLGKSQVVFSPRGVAGSPSPSPDSTPGRRENLEAARQALKLSSHRDPDTSHGGDRLRIVQDISERLHHLRSLPTLLGDLLDRLFVEMPISKAAILLRDPRGDYQLEVGRTRSGDLHEELGISRSLMEWVLTTGKPLLVPNAAREERYELGPSIEHHNLLSMACIPMMVERDEHVEVVGLLQVATVLGDPELTVSDLELLTVISNVAGVALENARLYEETQRRAEELEAIHELEVRLGSAADPVEFLRAIYEIGHEHLEASSSRLLLFDDDEVAIVVDPALALGTAPPHGTSNSERLVDGAPSLEKVSGAVQQELAAWLKDPAPLRLLRGTPEHPLWSLLSPFCEKDTEVAILVPLVAREHTRGVWALFAQEPEQLGPARLPLARVIGDQITSAFERRKLQQEGEKNRRLATVGRLVSTIMHDFKAPLHLILNLSEALERPDLDAKKRKEYGKIIEKQIHRCSGMAQELLDFSVGNRNYRFVTVSSTDFLGELEFLLTQELSRLGVTLEVKDDYQGPLRLDVDRMQRVIFNLSSNSIRVLQPGDTFRVLCRRVGDEVQFLVQDTGPGIPESIRGRVFEPFVSGPEHLSTGLGLSIGRDIAQGHGGGLEVDPEYRGGAGFILRLPLPGALSLAEKPEAPEGPEAPT